MKKILSIFALLFAVAFVGCQEKGGDEGIASFTLESEAIVADAEGGLLAVNYTIKNPQSGAVVLSNCSANWISDLSTATVGQIKFRVAPNYTGEERKAVIVVEYTAIDKQFTIQVTQPASDKAMFEFEVVVNEPTRLSINVTPADLSKAYICRTYTEDHIDAFNLYLDEFLAEYDLEAIEYEAYFMGQTLINYLQNISHTGKGFDIEFTKLFPDTNYVVYAYHIDLATGQICSAIHREVIRTAKPVTATFDVEQKFDVSGAVITQTITPADKEVYYYTNCWSVEDFYNYYGFSAEMEETFVAKWNESISIGVQTGYQPYQLVEQNCLKGDQTIVHNALKAETDYVIYTFAVNHETGFASSDIILEEVRTQKAHASNMTIEIEARNIFYTTADVYWTASDPNGKFARSVFTKADFEALGANDEEKLETCLNEYGFYQAYGSTDMNLTSLLPGTTYVAFAYGLDGETPNTRIFKTEFTTLSDNPGMSDINISWTKHYNMAAVAAADAANWGDYAAYENYTLVPMSISGVTASDEVYIMVTTMPIDYYSKEAEWLRDVAKEKNRVNCYTNYNYIAEYEKEYTVVAVAKDANGNYGKLFLEEMYLYRSDDSSASEYVYSENE